MRVLITGATGFIGSHLARRLAGGGHETHVIIRPDSDCTGIAAFRSLMAIHVHDGETAQLINILASVRPEVTFHLASRFVAEHDSRQVSGLITDNLLFPTQLLEGLSHCGCRYLVNTGTAWQHHAGDDEYHPVCLYAATKQAFEALAQFYDEAHQLEMITLKLFDTYGPDDRRGKLLSILKQAAREGRPLALSAGRQKLDLVHVDDVVAAFILAAQSLLQGKVRGMASYGVSSGRQIGLRELVALHSRISGDKIPIEWGARPYRRREVMTPWKNAPNLPGWRAKVSLEEGLQNMLTLDRRE